MRLLACGLVLALAGGCTAPRAAIVTGAGTMLAGGLLLTVHAQDRCSGDSYACPIVDGVVDGTFDAGVHAVGGLVIAAGAALAIAGLVALSHDEAPREASAAPVVQPPVTPAAAVEPGPGAIVALRAREQNRLAFQASATARAGQCTAAVMTATRLGDLDPELYRRLLEVDQVLATCVATVRDADQRM